MLLRTASLPAPRRRLYYKGKSNWSSYARVVVRFRLVQMSKCGSGSGSTRDSLRDWEYQKSPLLQLLGFPRVVDLGRKARRLFEEGRLEHLYVSTAPTCTDTCVVLRCFCPFVALRAEVLSHHSISSREPFSKGGGMIADRRDHGFKAELVQYCGTDVTSDNLAIICRR